MKNKIYSLLAVFTVVAAVLSGCQQNEIGVNTESANESEAVAEAEENNTKENNTKENNTSLTEEEVTALDGEETADEGEIIKERQLEVVADTFAEALKYIDKNNGEGLSVDFSKYSYEPGDRTGKEQYTADTKAINDKIEADELKTLRFNREDNAGSYMDVTVYTDPAKRTIDKIKAVEFCATGRENREYYFEDGKLVMAYEYQNDFYGTGDEDGTLPGKKCFFSDDVMAECTLNDADVNYENVHYVGSELDKYDEFTKVQYEQLEKDALNRAYTLYEATRTIPGYVKLYGYVGDEYGGVLTDVKMTLTSKANDFTKEFTTNGDGYFEIYVPVNRSDDYGLVCKYGEFNDSTVDDIRIGEGCKEYSLGVIYMAEPGKNVHDANTYLLNANYSSPELLLPGQYCITFSYEDESVDLKPYLVNTGNGKMKDASITVVSPGKDETYRYYVTDQRGGHTDNPMTYELSGCRGIVRVYDNKGLVAAYPAPIGAAGTVWEVFEVKGDRILPINNVYCINNKEPFFN